MSAQGLTDIDSLALAVRDRESRRLISEAITAYRGGALRSAIISTWIAVAYDIISKARELAAQGDAAAKVFANELDTAMAAKAIPKLQSIERDLLNTADKTLGLLAPHEFASLSRLYDDRHLCAHPAFVANDDLFQPPPELVRVHLVHSLQHLLIHAPLQGRSAVVMFDADILSPSFPTSSEDIATYVRSRYLDRAKDALVINLIKGVVTAPFGSERATFAGKEWLLTQVLRGISLAKPAIYDEVMPSFLARRFESVADNVLLKLSTYFHADERIWAWLPEPTRLRVRALISAAPLDDLKQCSAFDAFAIPELAALLMARFDSFDRAAQINVIGEYPRIEFVQPAIAIYGSAGGWREAEMLGQTLMLRLAPNFTAENIREMLAEVMGNGQIFGAAGTPAILSTIFKTTAPLLNEARPYWQAFVDTMTERQRGNADAAYAFPGIRELLDAA